MAVAALVILWACAAVLVLASSAPTLNFNMSFRSTDPFFNPVPARNLALNTSSFPRWNDTFSSSPWSSYVPGMVGLGDSLTGSNLGNTTVTVSAPLLNIFWYGDAVWMWGHMDSNTTSSWSSHAKFDQAITLSIDSKSDLLPVPSNEQLASKTGMTTQGHAGYFDQSSGDLSFAGATFGFAMQTEAPTFEQVRTSTAYWVVNGTRNEYFLYSGNWTVEDHIGGVGGQDPIPYDHMLAHAHNGDNPKTAFNVPDNTSFLMINGTIGPSHYVISVTITPAPMSNPQLDPQPEVFNFWAGRDAVLHYAVLDPAKQYNVTITGWSSDSRGLTDFGVHSVTFWSSLYDSGTSSNSNNTAAAPGSKGTSAGTIAGAAVGGVIGVIAIAVFAYFVASRRIRRRQQKLRQGDPSEFVVDENGDAAEYTPYDHELMSPMSQTSKDSRLIGTTTGASSSRVPIEHVRYEQEEDGGVLERVEFVPPQYNPEWAGSCANVDDALLPAAHGHGIVSDTGLGSGKDYSPKPPSPSSHTVSPATHSTANWGSPVDSGYSAAQMNQNPTQPHPKWDTKGWQR